MNERIRELYKNVLDSSENMRWNIEDAENFAKSIVKQCITQIALIGVSNFENDEHGDIGWTVDTSIEMIKDHFGITE